MGAGVSGSHERRSIKLCVHFGLSSAVRELPLRSSPEWVCLRLRLPPSSFVSVVMPGGWSRGYWLSVWCSTSRVWKPPLRTCCKFVRYSVEGGRPLLCCDVHTHTHTHTSTHTRTHYNTHIHTHTHTHTHTHRHTHKHAHITTHTLTHTFRYTHTRTHTHTNKLTQTHTQTRTRTHACAHTEREREREREKESCMP